jgi:hypothetical protein
VDSFRGEAASREKPKFSHKLTSEVKNIFENFTTSKRAAGGLAFPKTM